MTARMPVEDLKKPLLRGGGARLAEPSSASEPASPVVGILGTGDFSRSLARRLVASGYRVVVGSRSPRRHAALFPEEAELTDQRRAASEADLVFVAVYAEHYETLSGLREALAGKALVDVSNAAAVTREGEGPAQAERLAALFPESRVVKGFNVLSAWTLQTGPRDGNRQVPLCGDSVEAKACVSRLCRRLGFVPVDLGGLGAARDIENAPLLLFPAWRRPLLCALLLFLFFYAYNAVRDVLHPFVTAGKRAFYKLPLETVNVTLPAVALVLLALVYLPGVLAALLQLHRGTKYRRFPGWLAGWLARRKQLGLLSFLCAALHAVFSLSLPMRRAWRYKQLDEAFRQVKEQRASSWVEEEVWRMELYLCVGVLALGLLSLLAVTSLPSVASALNWREFSFVQNRLGYLALVLTTLHTLLFGWDRALDPARYRWLLPPTFTLALVLPCAVLLGRLALALPCLGGRLDRIRRGWEVRGGRGEGRGDGRSLEDVSGV